MNKPRTLKVQDVGDFAKKLVKPSIKLEGQWLMEAGINPYRTVTVSNPQPGTLIITLTQEISQ